MRTKGIDSVAFNIIAYLIIITISVICIFPFLLFISGSFTDNESIVRDGYHLIPKVFSLTAYKAVLTFPRKSTKSLWGNDLCYSGWDNARVVHDDDGRICAAKERFQISEQAFLLYLLHNAVWRRSCPWYIMITKYLQLTDTYAALIFPGLMTPFLIILMRSFIKSSIPEELTESSKIDGANDFTIYYRVVLPLAMPGIATVGLFLALHYWNSWFSTSLFINDQDKYELQYFLYNIINTAAAVSQLGVSTGVTFESGYSDGIHQTGYGYDCYRSNFISVSIRPKVFRQRA